MSAMAKHYTFVLALYSYDPLTEEIDYPIEKSFLQYFSSSNELVVVFPAQVMLS